MKLRTKLLLVVLPLVLASILAMGALSIRIAERSVRESAFLYLDTLGRSYIHDHPARLNDLLKINGLDGMDSYVAEFGKKAAVAAQNTPVRESGNIFALDGKGALVFAREDLDRAAVASIWAPLARRVMAGDGSNLRGEIETPDGAMVYSAQPFVPWGWAVFITLPEDRAFAALSEISRATLVMAGLFGLVTVFILFRLLRSFFVRPIMKLKLAAETIARGGSVNPVKIDSRDEIGQLAAGMNTMARAIERHRAEQSAWQRHLEEEVEARTRELAQTNEALRREIEERKQAADAFDVSEGKFRSLFNHMSSGFAYCQIIMDGRGLPVDFLFLEVNEQFEKLIGLSSRDVVGRKFTEAFPATEAERRRWIEIYGQVALTGRSIRFEEYSVHLDRWFSVSAYSAKWGFFAAVFEDITQRRKNEEHLLLLSTAIHQTDDSVSITDTEGSIQYVNPAFERMGGYSRDEVLGRNSRMLGSGKQDPAFYENMWRTIESGNVFKGRLTNRRKDGELYDVEMIVSPVKDKAGRLTNFVAVKRDVTRENILEKRLLHVQKMEAIGTLAGGIAHDFNNILGAIIGYTQLAMMDAPEGGKQHAYLTDIQAAGRRAGQLVKRILGFSRQADQDRRPVKVSPIVKEVLNLIRASLPSNIEIDFTSAEEQGAISGDPTQIHQILMNLCTNAAQAMGDRGGRLEVRLDDVSVNGNMESLSPGRYLRLVVSDTGPGIPDSIRDRIFEPYFSTKPSGEGTGLGLATVHGIVRSHQGAVTVESEPGQGARFAVYFPKIDDERRSETIPMHDLATGAGRILFVDDEPALANMGKTMLERLGYKVEQLTDSLAALELFRNHPDRFDLVITDQTMPRLTGAELAREVMAARPGTPVIICTGFSRSLTAEMAKEMGIKGFLTKPMGMDEVALTVKKALNV